MGILDGPVGAHFNIAGQQFKPQPVIDRCHHITQPGHGGGQFLFGSRLFASNVKCTSMDEHYKGSVFEQVGLWIIDIQFQVKHFRIIEGLHHTPA